jgi:hypothetical protein
VLSCSQSRRGLRNSGEFLPPYAQCGERNYFPGLGF